MRTYPPLVKQIISIMASSSNIVEWRNNSMMAKYWHNGMSGYWYKEMAK